MRDLEDQTILNFRKYLNEHLSGYLLIIDSSAKILYANEGVKKITGFTAKEIQGKPLMKLGENCLEKNFYERMWDTLQNKRKPFINKVIMRQKNGFKNSSFLHVAPILSHNSQIKYYLAIDRQMNCLKQEFLFQKEFMRVMQSNERSAEKVMVMIWKWLCKTPSIYKEDLKTIQSITNFYKDIFLFLENVFLKWRENARLADKHLLEEAQRQPDRFGDLYIKYKDRVFNYLFYRTNREREVAEELTQETFIRAFKALNHFEYQNCLYLAYLLTISHNLLINYYRSKKTLPLESFDHLPQTAMNQLEKTSDNVVDISIVWNYVSHLKPIEQKILRMKYEQDASIKTIAHYLDKSPNAIKIVLSRARLKLKKKCTSICRKSA